MQKTCNTENQMQRDYHTPDAFQNLRMCSDGNVLTGLWFVDDSSHPATGTQQQLPIFQETEHWLDLYFSGKQPDFTPAYTMLHLTEFRREVMELLKAIPYGQVTTYGAIAEQIAAKKGIPRMSAQAVGGAVGWNPIGIIIPCHRVIGATGALTGYRGGLQNKIALLKLEGIL